MLFGAQMQQRKVNGDFVEYVYMTISNLNGTICFNDDMPFYSNDSPETLDEWMSLNSHIYFLNKPYPTRIFVLVIGYLLDRYL